PVKLLENRLDAPEATTGENRLGGFGLGDFLGDVLELLVGDELQRFGIETVAQASRFRSVLENVAEVRIAARTEDLRTGHAVAHVRFLPHIFLRRRLKEARPPGAGFEFRVALEQRQIAPDAKVI